MIDVYGVNDVETYQHHGGSFGVSFPTRYYNAWLDKLISILSGKGQKGNQKQKRNGPIKEDEASDNGNDDGNGTEGVIPPVTPSI